MEAADVRTGRNVRTSHETVAGRVGMSKRHVGEARRLLEKLGLAVTVEMGRHLSPAERSQAKRLHGRYQEAAPSVRALIMPRQTEPVDTFHLPRRGSVLRESHLQKWSPTRAGARETAAARPKLRRRSSRRGASPTSPRPIEIQRFAWIIARNYGLDAGSALTAPGALHGGRHIGQLCNILQRYEITPERYTLATLRAEIDEAMAAARILPLENGQKRDRLAHFAWTLAKLREFTKGETRLQRQLRENAERRMQRRKVLQEARDAEQELQRTQREAEDAREAFLSEIRRRGRRSQPVNATERAAAAKTLVSTLIGRSTALYSMPARTQQLVGAITSLERTLSAHEWVPDHDIDSGTARWTHPLHVDELTISLVDASTAARARIVLPQIELPPAALDAINQISRASATSITSITETTAKTP